MPASAEFVAGLTKINGLTKNTTRILVDAGGDLERLATKATKSGERLTAAEENQFRKIYSDYLASAMNDRRAANNLGATDMMKAQEEIRGDFFNKVLGHIGKTDEDRIALRAALTRKAVEPKGDVLILADGTKVPRAEYDALKAMKKSGIDLGPNEAKWKMVQESEKAADEAAKAKAAGNHAADHAKASEAPAPKTEASSGGKGSNVHVEAAAKHIKSVNDAITDAAYKLDSTVKNGNKIDVDGFFGNLATLLRDESNLRLVDKVENSQLRSYKQITSAIGRGEQVSLEEFNALKNFFDKRFDVVATKDATTKGATLAPTNKWGTLAHGVEKAIDFIEKITPQGIKKPSRNALAEWESPTRSLPIFPVRMANHLLDHPKTAGLPALFLSGGLGTFGWANFGSDLSLGGEYGRFLTGVANAAIFEEDSIKDVAGYNDVVGRLYSRMSKNVEALTKGDQFDKLTKKITGIDLFADGKSPKKLDFSTSGNIEVIRDLIQKTQGATTGTGNYTDDELTAYKVFLSKMTDTSNGTEPWKPTSDINEISKSWSIRTAQQMKQDPELARNIINKFYGEGYSRDDERLLTDLHRKKGANNLSEAYLPVVANYLVQTGKIDKLETAMDPKLLQDFAKEKTAKTIESEAQVNALEMRRRSLYGEPVGNNAPTTKGGLSQKEVSTLFNTLAASDDYGVKGKASELEKAYNEAVSGGRVDPRKLNENLNAIQVPRATAETIRDFVLN